MKKNALIITVFFLVLALISPVMAITFTPSATAKPAPAIKGIPNEKGEMVLAEFVSPDGEKKDYTEGITVTSIEEAKELSPEIYDILDKEYKEISNAEDLSKVVPDIMQVAPSVFGNDVTAEELVVTDLFYLSVPEDAMPKDGSKLIITFVNSTNKPLIVLVKCSDTWTPVPTENVVNNGDGTVTVAFTELCPIAFVVRGEAATPVVVTPEPTKSNTGLIAWIIAAVAAIGGGTAYAVKRKKK